MELYKILLLLMLINPFISAYWYETSSSYTVEKPWEYQSWRCSPDAYGVISCEGKSAVVSDWPYVYYESCNCDEDGCESCPRCGRTMKSFRMSSLGYGTGAWNINEFEDALDGLELDVFTGNFSDYENYSLVTRNLELAYNNRLNALNYADICGNSSTYSAHNALLSPSVPAYTIGGEITFSQYRALMAPGGTTAPYPCTATEPNSPGGAYCKGYNVYWQSSVARAFDALRYSFSYTDNKIESQARPLHDRMENSGICDDDYEWDTGSACNDMASAFTIIDGNITEGTYGQYNSAMNYFNGLKKDVWEYPPELGNYSRIMRLLWSENGTIPLFTKLITDGNNALDDAENIYSGFVGDANAGKGSVDSGYSDMESNRISKINRAVEFSSAGSVGTIAERFSTFRREKLEAEQLLSNATAMHGRTATQGYLKIATRNAYDAKIIYERLADMADSILDDATEAVEQQRNQTAAILNQAKGIADTNPSNTAAKSSYLQAKNLFDRGEATAVLGDKFDYYVRAESYAWQALQEQGVVTNETEDLILQAEDLVRRAEMDGINVEAEKAMLDHLKEEGSGNLDGDLRSLIAGIIAKAEIKYGHLLDLREGLLENISLSAECGDYLESVLEKEERGIVSGGTIDYMNGIGRLNLLEKSYNEMTDELALCENSIIVNSLIISQSLYIERVKLDEETDARLLILITNPTHRSSEGVSVNIGLDSHLQLLYSDIMEGEENVDSVITEGNNLTLILKRIGPYWTRSISFGKSAVFAHTINTERNAVGIGGGKARVEETREFAVDANGAYIDILPPGDYDIVSASIDGKSAESLLDSGEHTLSLVYIVEGAYETNRSSIDASQVGLNTKLSYRISVMPSIDIDTLPFTIDMEYGNVSGIIISALSGASLTKEECFHGYCEIEISGLEEGTEAVIAVSYLILNTGESDTSAPLIPNNSYCIGGVEKECDPLPSGVESMMEAMNSASESGDYATAIELREKVKNEIDKWWTEQKSLANSYEKLVDFFENEKTEIESAFFSAGSLNDSLITDMKNRKMGIEDALLSAYSAARLRDAVSALETLDSGWKKNTVGDFRESAWEGYNSLKKRLFDAGVTAMPSEFLDVEDKINALAATESLGDAVKLALALADAERVVEEAEAAMEYESMELREEFLEMSESITAVLETYEMQMEEAEGTEWEGLFTEDPSGLEDAIDEIEDMFGKEDSRLIRKKMELLEKKKSKMVGILENLKDTSERMMVAARSSLETRRNILPYDEMTSVEQRLESMTGFISEGRYIGALSLGKEMLAELGGYSQEEGVNVFLVILAAVSVLAVVCVYIYRCKTGGGMDFTFLKKPKKEYRRLERAEQ